MATENTFPNNANNASTLFYTSNPVLNIGANLAGGITIGDNKLQTNYDLQNALTSPQNAQYEALSQNIVETGTPVGTSSVSDASTRAKIETLYRAGKIGPAQAAEKLFSSNAAIPADQAVNDFDKTTQNIIKTLFAVELKAYKGIKTASDSAASGISKANASIKRGFEVAKDDINEFLKPVSSATGGTLANLTGILRDPLGAPEAIGKTMAHLVDKVNPGFTDRLEATLKKYKTDDLRHLGSNVLGGLRSLASTVDAILSVPLSIAADIYNGLMDIMKELSDLLDTVVSGVMDLIFGPKGLLDSLLPMGEIMDFLSAVSEVAGIVGSIGGAFSGLNMVTGMASQLGSYAAIGTNTLSNPASLASSFMPPGVTQFTGALRNPEGLVSQLVPPQIQQQLGKVASLPGLGFVGNMGYGIGGALESVKGGVLTNIIDNFSSQLGVIGAQLGKPSQRNPYYNQTAAHPPKIEGSSTNPNLPVVANHGTRVFTEDKPLILAQKGSNNALEAATLSPVANLNAPNDKFKYNPNKNLTDQAISYIS